MIKKMFLITIFLCLGCQKSTKKATPFGIVIHGGAGTILRANMTPEKEAAYRAVLTEAIKVGHKILKEGGSSQEAVEKTKG